MVKTALIAMMMALAVARGGEPVKVIFDTDMGNDIDDALALAMLHGLESRGELKIVAVTVTKDNPWAARYVSAVNTFYGRGSIPVGVVTNGVTKEDGKYNRQSLAGGTFPYSDRTEKAPELIRRILAGAADQAVVVVQVGFSSNLAQLMKSAEDRALVARKVRLLSLMGGDFSGGKPEYNIREDIAAAQRLFAEWPTPVVVSGFEVGRTIKYPARSIESDFGWTASHPVVEGYKNYMKMPYDRETWDLTSVLYAARPDRGYFDTSEAGEITVDARGNTAFTARAGGRHRYLKVNDGQRAKILEAFVYLASQPK